MYIKIEKMKLVARDRYNTKEGLNFSFKKDDNASTTIPIFITEPNLFLEVLKQYRIKYSIVDNPDLTEIERKYSNQIKADILIRKAGI